MLLCSKIFPYKDEELPRSSGGKMKSVVFELPDGVYEKWVQYKKRHKFECDSGALFHLLEELRYSEEDILDIIQKAAISIIDASGAVSEEEMEKLPFLEHYLCDCRICSEEKAIGHTNLNGTIAISKKNFDMLNPKISVDIGLLDVLQSYIHETVHNLYPDAPKYAPFPGGVCSKLVQEKTKEIWLQGMAKIYDELVPQE
jgi:hypothetical protein